MPVQISDIGPPSTLESGATLSEEYWFGDFFDVGVCFASIATEPKFLGLLDVTAQGRTGYIRFIGGVPHLNERSWRYNLTTTNRSNGSSSYNLRIAVLTNG